MYYLKNVLKVGKGLSKLTLYIPGVNREPEAEAETSSSSQTEQINREPEALHHPPPTSPLAHPTLGAQMPSSSKDSPSDSTEESLCRQMQQLLDNWSKHKGFKDQTTTGISQPSASVKMESDHNTDIKQRIKACRCVRDFETLLSDAFRFDREMNVSISIFVTKINRFWSIFDDFEAWSP